MADPLDLNSAEMQAAIHAETTKIAQTFLDNSSMNLDTMTDNLINVFQNIGPDFSISSDVVQHNPQLSTIMALPDFQEHLSDGELTGTEMISSMSKAGADMVQQDGFQARNLSGDERQTFSSILETHGIDDPDGSLANGLGQAIHKTADVMVEASRSWAESYLRENPDVNIQPTAQEATFSAAPAIEGPNPNLMK